MSDDFLNLSPLDGRYAAETAALRAHFSEFAFLRDRVRVELEYLNALGCQAQLMRELTGPESGQLSAIWKDFSPADAQQIKQIETATRHDVKAIEQFIRGKLAGTSLADLSPFVHFGLTSEDVNNLAQALELRDSRDLVLRPALEAIAASLGELAMAHAALPMLARTHGQPAVPTTFGKEMAVFRSRLGKQLERLAAQRFEGKLNGAVGNFNAHTAAAPQIDWVHFSGQFIEGLGLAPVLVTTQTLPYENWIEYFQTLGRIHSILLDLCQDLWRYLSDDYLRLEALSQEVGSSTMPHKVNPIDLENAEGNLGLSNALLEHFARKLPLSRLQRDLSDSTVRRTFGTALGHGLTAYQALRRGLARLHVNAQAMHSDLDAHWEIVAEGAQTILRAAGLADGYEQLKAIARGQAFTQGDYQRWVEGLAVSETVRARLRALSPATYLGSAAELARRAGQ
jgi:adenylosuccinate lyase